MYAIGKYVPLVIICLVLEMAAAPLALADTGDYDLNLGERILSYRSDIEIHADSTMTVKETIRVQALGNSIKRGIYRDFPTRYYDQRGQRYEVGFKVVEVLRDGAAEPHHFERQFNGERLYIGQEDYFLPWGMYTYTITYQTNRQLGFFEDHDELYWNVTGNGWEFPIDEASALVTLPGQDLPPTQLEAYTGFYGEQSQYYTAEINSAGQAFFYTTTPLSPEQGLTIVVSFPKGVVTEPSRSKIMGFWIQDHHAEIWGMVGLAIVILFYFFAWLLFGIDPRGGRVTPQDAPPPGLSAAGLRYVQRMGTDFTTFTSALTSMAIKGYLRIETDNAGSHTLVRDSAPEDVLAPEERELGRELFNGRSELLIDQDNHTIISGAKTALDESLGLQCRRVYFLKNTGVVTAGVIASLAVFIVMMAQTGQFLELGFASIFSVFLLCFFVRALVAAFTGWGFTVAQGSPDNRGLALLLAIVLLVLGLLPLIAVYLLASLEMALIIAGLIIVNSLFAHLLPRYTRSGRRLLDHAAGFRNSLMGYGLGLPGLAAGGGAAAMAFLPYAIALSVHRQWARQLEEVFAVSGREPLPAWYHDRYHDNMRYERVISDLAGSFTHSISSSAVAPGSSSGGGGGSSGGGGGGGGGGGW